MKTLVILLGLVSALSACNPARDLPFDFQLYGTWKRAEMANDLTKAGPVAFDYLEVTDKGEVLGVFLEDSKPEVKAGVRPLGRVTGNRLRLTDKAVEFVTERHLNTQKFKASLTESKIHLKVNDASELILTVKQPTLASSSGAEVAEAQSEVKYVKISRGDFDKETRAARVGATAQDE